MTQFFFVRHGPTHAKSMVGWSDLPADLSDTQALSRLSDYLPSDAVVISSDLIRAAATADALERERTRLPHDATLREMHFGEWELRTFSEIETEDPATISAFWQEPGAVRAPGGESWSDMRSRVDPTIDALAAQYRDRAVIVVCHFGVILGQLERAWQIDTTDVFGQRIDNLPVTELRARPAGWSVGAVNHRP